MAYMTRLLSGAALAVAAALAVSACASASASPPAAKTGTASTSAAPALTSADARQVFDSYVSASARATAQRDQAAALALTEGVQWNQVKADFLRAGHGNAKLPLYRYGSPVFYLPEQSGYPRWFVADAPRSTVNGTANAGTLAGLSLPASGHVLMLFEKASAAGPWLLASSAQLAPGESVPKLAAANGTGSGSVATASTTDTSLLARPDVAGALQAAVVDDGPASAAARVVADGPLTTVLHAAQAALAPAQTPRGDVHFWALDGSNFTKFVLRTADGGALVFYTMYLNTTTEVPAEYSNSSPVLPGPEITVPAEFAPFLTPGTPAPRVRLITQLTLAFAAVDPPSGPAKIQVIAIGGGPNYAVASLADGA
ncbi:MAG TPA: hypothetical protein VF482_08045 [Trebonia sp.]